MGPKGLGKTERDARHDAARKGGSASPVWQDEFALPPGLRGLLPEAPPAADTPPKHSPATPESRAALRGPSVFGRGPLPAPGAAQLVDDDLSLLALLRVRHDPERLWADLPLFSLPPGQAAARHLVVRHQEDPVGLLYDHLRTRLVQALAARGWSRVAVCAPTRGCGASLLACNLALSLARRPSGRALLMDMDFRHPALAGIFGAREAAPLRDLLTGLQPVETLLQRFGTTLALGLNGRAEPDAAELLAEPATREALRQLAEDYAPDVVVYDLPPVLESDDVLAFLPQVDGVLLVVDGTRNTAAQVRDCERLLKGGTELLGIVMNRAEDSPAARRRWR